MKDMMSFIGVRWGGQRPPPNGAYFPPARARREGGGQSSTIGCPQGEGRAEAPSPEGDWGTGGLPFLESPAMVLEEGGLPPLSLNYGAPMASWPMLPLWLLLCFPMPFLCFAYAFPILSLCLPMPSLCRPYMCFIFHLCGLDTSFAFLTSAVHLPQICCISFLC